jgi:hypothetical protein
MTDPYTGFGALLGRCFGGENTMSNHRRWGVFISWMLATAINKERDALPEPECRSAAPPPN